MQSREEKAAAILTLLPLIFSHLDCHGSRRRMVARYYAALASPAAPTRATTLELWEMIYATVRKRYRIQDINLALVRLFLEQPRLFWAMHFQTLEPWPDWMRRSGEALAKAGLHRLAELVEGDVIGYEPRDDEATTPQLRDREVRRMMGDGYSSRRIAASLGTGQRQVLESAQRMGLQWETPRLRKKGGALRRVT